MNMIAMTDEMIDAALQMWDAGHIQYNADENAFYAPNPEYPLEFTVKLDIDRAVFNQLIRLGYVKQTDEELKLFMVSDMVLKYLEARGIISFRF